MDRRSYTVGVFSVVDSPSSPSGFGSVVGSEAWGAGGIEGGIAGGGTGSIGGVIGGVGLGSGVWVGAF